MKVNADALLNIEFDSGKVMPTKLEWLIMFIANSFFLS